MFTLGNPIGDWYNKNQYILFIDYTKRVRHHLFAGKHCNLKRYLQEKSANSHTNHYTFFEKSANGECRFLKFFDTR